jgi:hypothetical protein
MNDYAFKLIAQFRFRKRSDFGNRSAGPSPTTGTLKGQLPGTTSTPDATNKIDEFVKDALLGGMTEVELGKEAVEKGSGDPAKQFA